MLFFPQNSLKPESNIFAVRHLPLPCNMQGNYPGGALEHRCKKKKAAVGILGHFPSSGFVKFREIGHVSVRDFKFPRCRN